MDAVVRDGNISVSSIRDGVLSVSNVSNCAFNISNVADGQMSLRTIYKQRLIMIDSTGAMLIDSDGDLLAMYDYNLKRS